MIGQLVIGSHVDEFELDRRLGDGPIGCVYLATHPAYGRVALKLIEPGAFADDAARRTCVRGLTLAAAVSSPGFLPIHEVGEHDRFVYVAYQYVDAVSLATLLAERGPLSYMRAVRLTGQLAEALDEIHAHGLAHGSIKPSNVLVEQANNGLQAYLVDACMPVRDALLPDALPYAAPEQLRGGVRGRAADVFSLACVTFETSSGRVPYPARTPEEALAARLAPDAPASGSIGQEVLERALAHEPADRFGDAREFSRALLAAGKGRVLSNWQSTLVTGSSAAVARNALQEAAADDSPGADATAPVAKDSGWRRSLRAAAARQAAKSAPEIAGEERDRAAATPGAKPAAVRAAEETAAVAETPAQPVAAGEQPAAPAPVPETPAEPVAAAEQPAAPAPVAETPAEPVAAAEEPAAPAPVSETPAEPPAAAHDARVEDHAHAVEQPAQAEPEPADGQSHAEEQDEAAEEPAHAPEADAPARPLSGAADSAPQLRGATSVLAADGARRRRSRTLVAVGAAVSTAAVALIVLAIAGVFSSSTSKRAGRAPVAATPPRAVHPTIAGPAAGASAPVEKAPVAKPSTPAIATWPAGKTGYTAIVFAAPGARADAVAHARAAAGLGVPVGVLLSDSYAHLPSGYWVTFAGVYDSAAAAQHEADVIRSRGLAASPYVRTIYGH